MKKFIIASLILSGLQGIASAEKNTYVTPKLGQSSFTGLVGVEVQMKHWALDLGYPLSGGVRYYLKSHGHSWFAGLYGQGESYYEDNYEDGIQYTHYSAVHGGIGTGYRWMWRERWNLELGLSVGAGSQRWSNASMERKDNIAVVKPVASVGFSF